MPEDEDEKFSAKEAEGFAYFLYYPETIVEWWKSEDEFLINGEIQRRHYRRMMSREKKDEC